MIRSIEPHTPIQYIMGKAEFCGMDFMVDERVLIPRPETELIVETAIELARGIDHSARILDLCTGSGNISISLTKFINNCTIIASDLSDEALAVAGENARRFGVAGRIELIKSDLFQDIQGYFDIIVSNPPYIARNEFFSLQPEVLREPRIALDGGDDGLEFYRRIASQAPGHLTKVGALILEIGFGQRDAICKIFEDAGALRIVDFKTDHNGIDRVVIAKWTN